MRLVLLVAIIVSAVLLPAITVTLALPDVRIEQVLALPALLWLISDWMRDRHLIRRIPILSDRATSSRAHAVRPYTGASRRGARRAPSAGASGVAAQSRRTGITVLDWLFAALALSTLASILWARFVLDSPFSPRDLYEALKPVLYWTFFRFGLQTVERSETGVRTPQSLALAALLLAGTLAGAAGIAQYFNVLDLNSWATPLWAPAHHLRTLARDARAVGTVGNPNYYGMLCAVVVLASVATLALCRRRLLRRLAAASLLGGAAGLVAGASRGATLALLVGLCVIWVGMIVCRRDRVRAMGLATAAAVVALAATALLVESMPRGRVTYLARMTGSLDGDSDAGLALRLERWRSALVPWIGEGSAAAQDLAPAAGSPALNLLDNGSLERGGSHADGFRTLEGTRYELTESDARFGMRSVRFLGNPAAPHMRAALFQQRFVGEPGGTPLTAQLSVRLDRPIEGDLSLYTNVFYADGTRSDPHSRVSVDPTRLGVWQDLTAPIAPESGRTISYVGVYLMGEGFRGEALVDGFALHDGAAPLAFASLSETPAALSAPESAARLRASPLLGVGPAKAEPASAAATDNEYLLIATRYGVIGLAVYLALWAAVLWTMLHGFGRSRGASAALRIAMAATVAGLLVFNLVAGSFLHLQLMGLVWPLAGVAAVGCANDG